MFRSTSLKLTGWYLLILMSLSLAFSLFVYQIANNEIHSGLERFQTNLQVENNPMAPSAELSEMRDKEQELASNNLSNLLFYVNVFVLVIGGLVSYVLARKSLEPIESAHEMQSRFTSDASHELRTPLAVMKTEIEVALSDNVATINDMRDVLSSNLEEVDRLSKLAEMLLSLSRFDNTTLKTKALNLSKIASSTIKDFKKPANRLKLTIKDRPTIMGNDAAIIDLIRVLVDNALLYSPDDSLVTVTLSKNDNDAIFKISNFGSGINAEKLPFIFDRFYRADSSRTTGEQKGYGLGLALAKTIAIAHKGSLTASSALDSETVFSFSIPIYNMKLVSRVVAKKPRDCDV